MTWITANWVWLLVGVAFIAMHLVGRGGHDSDSGITDRDQRRRGRDLATNDTATTRAGRERDPARRQTTEPRSPQQH